MQQNEALAFAQKYLAQKERSEYELFNKLVEQGCSNEVSESVLEHAKSESWVCDERYCTRYCELQLCKGYGPLWITEQLKQKNLTISAIVRAVADIDFSTWEHAAILAVEKKFGRDYKNEPRLKVINYLESKGFNDEYMMFLLKD